MAKYIAYQIYIGKMDYNEAIEKYPQFKDEIDTYLVEFENQNM